MLREIINEGNAAQCLALSRLRLGALLSNRIKIFRGRRRSQSDECYARLEFRGNVAQCFALLRLRLGFLLSNRIKNLSGAEAKPERRRFPEIRNGG